MNEDEIIWEYDIDGWGMSEGYYSSQDAAYDAAYTEWTEGLQDEFMRNGDTTNITITLYKILLDSDGNTTVLTEVTETLEYEHYHGDYEEHNTYYPGGAL